MFGVPKFVPSPQATRKQQQFDAGDKPKTTNPETKNGDAGGEGGMAIKRKVSGERVPADNNNNNSAAAQMERSTTIGAAVERSDSNCT